jgi:ABC-2 type transport system ATP-binding protein
MSILTTHQLTKHYGKITALNGLSIDIQPGMVYGILGPNGSGKTTTLGIVLGITRANSGTFQWFEGKYGKNARRQIGSLLETPNFYPNLNAVDNLQIVAHIKKVAEPKIDERLELVNLLERKHSRFTTYSLGMKQRLAIAAAMIGDPEVLILDEPTNGLDPQGIAEVRNTILQIAQMGKTIIMASHILDEVEKICSHVAIIKRGHLLATGTVGSILSDDQILEVSAADMPALKKMLAEIPEVNKMEEKEGLLLLHIEKGYAPARINDLAFRAGIILSHLRLKVKSLEAEFLEITSDH